MYSTKNIFYTLYCFKIDVKYVLRVYGRNAINYLLILISKKIESFISQWYINIYKYYFTTHFAVLTFR